MTEIDTTSELTDENIDSLVERSESSSNREIPMTSEEVSPAAAPKEDAPFIEFTHEGKSIKATREQALKWAQMGYNYPQKAQALNQKQIQWDQQRQQWEGKWGVYKQIDDWATKNPDKWQALQNQWQGAQQPGYQAQPQAGQPPNPYDPKIQMLESKLSKFENFVTQAQAEKEQAQMAQEDTKLETEIKSIRDQYKDIDFDTLDDEGKSLEFKVLEHAQTNGIPNFKTAFRDFYHDQLVAKERAAAQQGVAKTIQQKTKMGILGETPIPKKVFSAPRDIKKQSYEELAREGLEELRRMSS